MNPTPLPLEQFKRHLHDHFGDVVHLQTHISHVFLAGDYAYKIKKPVNFGFLDFTDRGQRQFFCEEEIRLNRRLAPKLYLGVVGLDACGQITQTLDESVEPMIQMRRFDQADRLDNYAQAQGLDEALTDELALQIYKFHDIAAPAATASHFGTPDTVYFPINQNFEQIRGFLTEDADLNQIDQIEAASEAAFLRLKPLITARKQNGHVRECHGDMHLGNIARIQGEVVLFDGIEFNEDFRWSDTASDLAFLLMDLTDRRFFGAARRLLNTYLEASGDYAALPLIHFYQAYRAMVRAKVALFELRSDMSATEQATQWATFRRYTALALSFLTEHTPELWITVGFSGSGKSLAALELVQAVGAVRLRSDAERQRMYPERSERYNANANEFIYTQLANIARTGLEAGWPMVVDATFLKAEQRATFAAIAAKLGCPFYLLFIECDAPTLRRYLRERAAQGKDISEADEAVLEMQLQQLQPLTAQEQARSFRLRCDAPFAGQISDALAVR
ncbi:MAG: AAA family ATPase [Halothiobacillaceae bacterium]|nr:AAA family ATPase [Halothiobacillaceae bacterium]HUM99746.1 AAA family ATPase [Halothiobacillus sp.]